MKIERIESEFLGSNTFVVSEGDECLLIDAGVSVKKLLTYLRGKKVVGVLLTHGHYDHVYYAEDYKERFACPIYISKEGKRTALNSELNYSEGFSIKKRGIFNVFEIEKTIKCGDFKIKVLKTPGHCPGCVCYLIGEHLFAGDTLFKTGIGRCDLINSDKKAMLESLKKLQGVKFETLHSGHGEDSSYDEQKRNLSAYIRFLERRK